MNRSNSTLNIIHRLITYYIAYNIKYYYYTHGYIGIK